MSRARTRLILFSEDLNLRQYAARFGVKGGAWLQVVLSELVLADMLPAADYYRTVGMFGAMRHDHLALDAQTLAC